MPDRAEELFADLAGAEAPPVTTDDPHRDLVEYYPGSSRRIEDAPPPPEPEERPWDYRSKTRLVDGVEIEFFPIGALAEATNRKPVTIRSWEDKGIMPKARYRDTRNRRLYTRAQVEGVRALCAKHGILDFDARPDRIPAEFTSEVIDLWKQGPT